jgi:hypothetical protein
MNNAEPDEREQLLKDVLGGESFEAFNAKAKQQAMVAFRRGHLMRRALTTTGMAGVVGLVAVAGMMTYQWERRQAAGSVQSAATPGKGVSEIASANSPRATKPELISEEQLVALFPAESCFVAEVDGKKRLVFRSAELRKQYLHEPN